MKIAQVSSLVFIVFLLSKCAYDDINSSSEKNNGPDIYVAGLVENGIGSGNDEVTYWKNGSKTTLAVNYGIANSIFVRNNNVYVAGINPYAAYWKDGVLVQLERDDSYASSIFVSKTGDAYVAGRKSNSAAIWKNGVVTSLTAGNSTYSFASSIFVSDADDVYAAGYAQTNLTENATATVWKNGIAQPLTDGSDYAIANSIIVSGSDVYVAGYRRTIYDSINKAVAVLWKNGTEFTLPDSSNFSFANSVFVSPTGDVYLAGTVGGNKTIPVYWKNGIAVLLPANDIVTGVSSIVELNNDVFISGTVGQHAVYWKNGEMSTLDDSNAPNGSSASSIFVNGKVITEQR